MQLQDKINKRIDQLEAELEQLNSEFNLEVSKGHNLVELNRLSESLVALETCIKELKQLLN